MLHNIGNLKNEKDSVANNFRTSNQFLSVDIVQDKLYGKII
jgi:hypothetical protein